MQMIRPETREVVITEFTRREFLKLGAGACLAGSTSCLLSGVVHAGPGCATVHVVAGEELSDLYRMAKKAVRVLLRGSGLDFSGKSVFIKPNLVSQGAGFTYDPYAGDCTKAEILVGIARQCLEAGAQRVSIGDAAQGMSWDWASVSFFEGNRILGTKDLKGAVERLQEKYPRQDVELLCLNHVNQWTYIPSCSDHEIMRDGLMIATAFHEADHVISVPVLKSHVLTDITCSMKNFVGITPCLPPYAAGRGRDKLHHAYANITHAGFEKAGIEACFLDILKWRREAGRQDLAVVDCTIGVEGNGPATFLGLGETIDFKARSPLGNYFLLAGADLVAVDSIAYQVTNHDVSGMKQLVMATTLGLGEPFNIELRGDATLDQLRIPDFEKASHIQDWGVSPSTDPSLEPYAPQEVSRAFNTMAGVSIPAGATYLLKRLNKDNPPPCERERPVLSAKQDLTVRNEK